MKTFQVEVFVALKTWVIVEANNPDQAIDLAEAQVNDELPGANDKTVEAWDAIEI